MVTDKDLRAVFHFRIIHDTLTAYFLPILLSFSLNRDGLPGCGQIYEAQETTSYSRESTPIDRCRRIRRLPCFL